jgi:hypothetical protein
MGFFDNLRTLLSKPKEPEFPPLDLNAVLRKIKQKEADSKIEPGRKIHAFEYGLLEIRFDRDITLNGRICIFSGKERLFTFTVFAKQGDYDILKQAFVAVIEFLESDRSIKNLPDNNILKGHINH